MGIGKRIKEARNALGLTQDELATILGVTKGAVANYENETSHPKEPIMYKMFDALNVDANFLFQDEMNCTPYLNEATPEEFSLWRYFCKRNMSVALFRKIHQIKMLRSFCEALESPKIKSSSRIHFGKD